MDDEDYEFDYEDSDQDQDDGQVDMENEYYTAKGASCGSDQYERLLPILRLE